MLNFCLKNAVLILSLISSFLFSFQDHINVSFDKTIIKKHFENLNNFQPHFDNVTELILYTSKRNCDYKKIIKLVKLACNDEVDIKFTRVSFGFVFTFVLGFICKKSSLSAPRGV